jgi:predicted permease
VSLLDAIRYRWRAAWHRGDLDRDIEAELRAYADLDAEQHRYDGADGDKAWWAARRRVGNVTSLREGLREMSTIATLADQVRRDARYAARFLRNSPTFAIVATLTLALGVGANATIFSIVDAVMLRALPFPRAEQLVTLATTRDGLAAGSPSFLDVRDVARDARAFQRVVAYDEWRKNVAFGDEGAAEQMAVGLVSRDYFETLGIRPIMGRLFSDQEQRYGSHYVAAINQTLWRDRFGGSRDVVGNTIRINDETYTIVAVVPDIDLAWLNSRGLTARVWTPWAQPDTALSDANRGATGAVALARLLPGVSLAQARAELARVASRLAQTYPADRPYGMTAFPLVEARVGPMKAMLTMLGGGVAIVLLIACTNLAGLLHARNAARHREILVRTALGASRVQIARQLLVETLLLACAGGAGGFALAVAGCAAVSRWHPPQFPQLAGLTVNGTVLAFALIVSVTAGGVFGLWPAWSTSHVDLASSLRAGGRTGTASREQRRARSALVIVQVALAMMLLSGSAVLVQSVARLRNQDLGFATAGLFKAHVYVPPARYTDASALTRVSEQFTAAVSALPGVESATLATGYLPAAARWPQTIDIEGQPLARSDDKRIGYLATADESYLRTYGAPIVEGRDLTAADAVDAPAVAIVNQAFVRRFVSGRSAVGLRIRLGDPLRRMAEPRAITIVGVFKNMKNDGLANDVFPQVVGLYRQLPEFNSEFKDIIVRTKGDPASLASPVRGVLRELDPSMPLAEAATMREVVATASGGTTYAAALLGAFAALGLVLAAIGIYGVIAYMVAQRRAEIGIRSALGATPAQILKLVVGSGCVLGLTGSLVGVVGATATRGALSGQTYGVSPSDPLTLMVTVIGLVIVAAVASIIPASRALRIDPVGALRGE